MDLHARTRTRRLLSNGIYACLTGSRALAVHFPDRDQTSLAQRFFSPTTVDGNTINGEPFVPGRTRAPVLQNASAYFEAVVHHICELGDHAVVVMEVVEAECRTDVRPLTVAASPWEYGG